MAKKKAWTKAERAEASRKAKELWAKRKQTATANKDVETWKLHFAGGAPIASGSGGGSASASSAPTSANGERLKVATDVINILTDHGGLSPRVNPLTLVKVVERILRP